MPATKDDEEAQRRLLMDMDDYPDEGPDESPGESPPHPASVYNTPLPESYSKKRHLSHDDHPQQNTRNIKHKTQNQHSPNPTTPTRTQTTYTKLFINTDNIPKLNYLNFNKKLTTNKYHTHITHIQRARDNTGYILTFKDDKQAHDFQNTAFNNELDSCTIRNTHKPTRKIHTDILIHNVHTDITEDEIKQDITEQYKIQVHSTYRLTRKSKYPPHMPFNTNTVKITIDKQNEHLFTDKITLFTFNKHRTSKPTPPPTITQCYTCFNYGHTRQQCQQTTRTCIKCGKQHTGTCTQTNPTCLHCKQQHVPTYRNCPTYKSILQDAKEQQRRTTYAQIAQKQNFTAHPPTQQYYTKSQPTVQQVTQPSARCLLPTPQPVPLHTHASNTTFLSHTRHPLQATPLPQRAPRHNRTYTQTQSPQSNSPRIHRFPIPPQTYNHPPQFTHTNNSIQDTLQGLFQDTTLDQQLALLTQIITIITKLMDNLRQQNHSSHTAQCR